MAVGTLLVTANLVFIRYLNQALPTVEVIFLRYVFSFLALMPWMLRAGPANVFQSLRPGLHAMRAVVGAASSITWYVGLSLIPMAEAVALNFLSAIFLGIGAIVFLGEASLPARWWAAGFGFLGMLVIIRPGFESISAGSVIVIASAFLWSISLLIMKVLVRADSPLSLVAYLYVFGMLLLLPFTLVSWQWPSAEELLWVALMGVASSLGNLAVAQAFKEADTTAIVPVDFMRLIWAAIIGYLFFSEIPGGWTLLGGLIIFGSTTYLTLTEQKRA